MSRPRHLVALVGPTASGKTAAAVVASRRLDMEVISADSRQVRAGMRIGTAAPTETELTAVPHHLVGTVAPNAPFTVVDWLRGAREALDVIWGRDAQPLLVGGTGQYVWALLEGWEVPSVPADEEFRQALEEQAAADGHETLHARLAAVDPASAARIDPRNVRRVIRALEIVEDTGRPVPPLAPGDPGFTWAAVGLRWSREVLHTRVERRTRTMFHDGLLEETQRLVERYGREFPALQSIGYPEALAVLDGDLDVDEAIERVRRETHRLIRMQANWFREDDPRIAWVDGDAPDAILEAVETAARAPVR